MRVFRIVIFSFLFFLPGLAFSQIKDSVPLIIADSLKAVYIYADTGKAINRVDAQGRKQGLWEKRYPDGKLRYRGHFLDDNPTGVFKYYWDNDSIQNITVYSEKGKVARTKMFYENGGLLAVGKFVDRKEDSIWVRYSEAMRLISKEQYKLGKKDGKFLTFYFNGNVLEVKTWRDGLENGSWQQFFPDGQLKLESGYVNGKRDGILNVYDEGNTDFPVIHGKYVNDVKDGPWIYYISSKNTRDTVLYRNGKALNIQKFMPNHHQLDSLRQNYQELQQQLDNPGENGGADLGRDY